MVKSACDEFQNREESLISTSAQCTVCVCVCVCVCVQERTRGRCWCPALGCGSQNTLLKSGICSVACIMPQKSGTLLVAVVYLNLTD